MLLLQSAGLAIAQSAPAAAEEAKTEQEKQLLTHEQRTLLERLFISSARTTGNVLDVPSTITVIDRETLERHLVRDIQDMVRYEPGISVTRQTSLTNPFGQLTGFNIRAMGGNRVQMTVDGSRVQEQIIDGSRDFVDPFTMRSVELVRGPNSVLQGADALGGAVAFRTLDPSDLLDGTKPWAAEVKTAYDSYDRSFRQQASAAAEAGDFRFLGSFGHLGASEGDFGKARADGGQWGCPREPIWPCNKAFPADTDAFNGLMKLQWNPSTEHEFELTGEWFNRTTTIQQMFDSSAALGGYRNADWQRELEMERYRLAVSHDWKVDAPWLDGIKWQVSYSPQRRDTTSTQLRVYPTRDQQNIQVRNYGENFLEADIQANSSFDLGGISHKLTYGFDGDLTDSSYTGYNVTNNLTAGTSTVANNQGFNFPEVTTRRADIYLQDEIKLLDGRLTLTPGLRLATYSIDPTGDTDYVPLPGFEPKKIDETRLIKRVGAIYELDDTYSLYAGYGEGFKMPTSQQLFVSSLSIGSTGFVEVIPNPNLKPEFVRSYELGLRGELDRGYLSLTGFYADYKDFIRSLQPVPGPAERYTSDNVEQVKVWGIELGGEYEIYDDFILTAAVSYQKGRQRVSAGSAETPFDGAVPLTAVLGGRYLIPEWNLETELVATLAHGVTERSDPDAFKPGGYAVIDAYARWKPTRNVDIDFGIENIFDRRYFPNTISGTILNTVSSAVADANNPEMQVAPGRTFKLGATVRF
ncbi:MAG: TonB-dependent hemoglobin/transferrin/lactoferrin family receptor [Mesorhizobium sp.]